MWYQTSRAAERSAGDGLPLTGIVAAMVGGSVEGAGAGCEARFHFGARTLITTRAISLTQTEVEGDVTNLGGLTSLRRRCWE